MQPHSFIAWFRIVSNTGCVSPMEVDITFSTSMVAPW